MKNLPPQSKMILRPAAVLLGFLFVAFLGNQFVDGWNWSISDFIIMSILIFGTGLLIELASKKIKKKNHKYIAIFLILAGLLWLWVELAVGLFTNWGS